MVFGLGGYASVVSQKQKQLSVCYDSFLKSVSFFY